VSLGESSKKLWWKIRENYGGSLIKEKRKNLGQIPLLGRV